jgi:hypothetical protein
MSSTLVSSSGVALKSHWLYSLDSRSQPEEHPHHLDQRVSERTNEHTNECVDHESGEARTERNNTGFRSILLLSPPGMPTGLLCSCHSVSFFFSVLAVQHVIICTSYPISSTLALAFTTTGVSGIANITNHFRPLPRSRYTTWVTLPALRTVLGCEGKWNRTQSAVLLTVFWVRGFGLSFGLFFGAKEK